jgi:hypothetical protein
MKSKGILYFRFDYMEIEMADLEVIGLENGFVDHETEHQLRRDADGKEDGRRSQQEHEPLLLPVAPGIVGRLLPVGHPRLLLLASSQSDQIKFFQILYQLLFDPPFKLNVLPLYFFKSASSLNVN